VFNSFIRKIKDIPTNKQKDDFYFELNKKYGNLSRDGFNNALQKSYEAYKRETKPQSLPNKNSNKPSKNNKNIFFILGAFAVTALMSITIWWFSGNNTEKNEQQTTFSTEDKYHVDQQNYNQAIDKYQQSINAFADAVKTEKYDYELLIY